MPTEDLPGADLVAEGTRDLEAGVLSVPALLLLIGAWRLRHAGIPVPERPDVPDPEGALYTRLRAAGDPDAHGRYLSLTRRLESLERAAEARAGRLRRARAAPPSGA